ncbi:ArsR/SmtB family transcription factor [Thiomicrorhabdus indica]|jgi:ArsR family transcriptional regulator|uniref:ArsR/SmtB family transcription factor n=1 Tax=Thiomicrorhabdus indica TaxID=2267253 RepID=UPI00197E5F19|nr:metalloregulator ArsR/SmtB family transcription factor [Thiomicrorhabdus indica]
MSTQSESPFEMKEENISKASKALKAMGHPLRLKILCVIGGQELPVMDIVKQVGTTQSNISQHIDILREKEIITSRREGSKILCKIRDPKILNLMDTMQQTFCQINDL